jgi:uncharacterized protein RhaS with RHS repeats
MARYYDPAIGRYTQVDPLHDAAQTELAPYAYASNNPLLFTDPRGLLPKTDRPRCERWQLEVIEKALEQALPQIDNCKNCSVNTKKWAGALRNAVWRCESDEALAQRCKRANPCACADTPGTNVYVADKFFEFSWRCSPNGCLAQTVGHEGVHLIGKGDKKAAAAVSECIECKKGWR